MNLVFFDPLSWRYDSDTPLYQGLGGSQSAACYLAEELATRGHEVVFVNGVECPRGIRGVRFIGRGSPDEDRIINSADFLIVINAAMGGSLRMVGVKAPMILWAGHDADQPAVQMLRYAQEPASWDRIVCLSQWQADRYAEVFGPSLTAKIRVIGHGLAPPFVGRRLSPPSYHTPVLAYCSTPFRGLDRLLDVFPTVRQAIPDVRLKIFSDMKVYQGDDAPYAQFYERAQTMEGVEHVGSVGQYRLADELAECTALAYPCTFPETYCIVAAEAVAAGATPIVTPLGALPEVLDTAAIYTTSDGYGKTLVNILQAMKDQPWKFAINRASASLRFRQERSWPARADEWEEMLRLF